MNVSNRKCVRTLARRSLRASRTRNLIAVLAIALTTVLFTSLFTIALSINDGFQQVAALTNWRTSSMEDSDTKNSDMKGHLLNDCIQTVGLCFIIRVSPL